MSREEKRATVSRLSRRLVAILLVGAAAVVVWGAMVSWPHFKASVYNRRILQGRNVGGNLEQLRALDHPAAVRHLQLYALLSGDSGGGMHAGRILYESYPDSYIARGMRDYEAIAGRPYFARYWRNIPLTPETYETRLREWLACYPVHPGRDDALLRLAIHVRRSRPLESLRILHEAFGAPDGDKQLIVARRFQEILAEECPLDALAAWIRDGCPDEILDNVLYAAGVKCLQERRGGEALAYFDRSVGHRREDGPLLVRGSNRYEIRYAGRSIYDRIDEQIAACRWFVEKERELEAARSGDRQAEILHAMGRRAFHREDDFKSWFWREYVLVRREGPDGPQPWWEARPDLEDISPAIHYRQAAEYFLRIVREHPEYREIEKVAYSIPLCIWRVHKGWFASARGLDEALYRRFQAFADKYPESTMADEALYLAGIHHLAASRWRDHEVIEANSVRIVREHFGGNIIELYGPQSGFIRRAIESEVISPCLAVYHAALAGLSRIEPLRTVPRRIAAVADAQIASGFKRARGALLALAHSPAAGPPDDTSRVAADPDRVPEAEPLPVSGPDPAAVAVHVAVGEA
ncbi:MAG: hypothetical protein JXA90_00295, partial [Planctomycetes bacterium]|nr:hypothetical protein [Planctomycetota bacterium]